MSQTEQLTKLKTINIKGKDYVEVCERIRYFNENYPNGAIRTEIVSASDGVVTFKATAIPDIERPERYFSGYAQEKENGSFINKTSYIENCETSAVGRALGMMGIGVKDSVASYEEVLNAIKNQEKDVEFITDKQLSTIRDFLIELGMEKKAPQFVKYLGVETLEKLPAKDYRKAISALEAKKAKVKK